MEIFKSFAFNLFRFFKYYDNYGIDYLDGSEGYETKHIESLSYESGCNENYLYWICDSLKE